MGIHWKPEERAKIANSVYARLHGRFASTYDQEIVKLVREAMVSVLEPHRHREISGISQVKWIRPLLASVWAAEHPPLTVHTVEEGARSTEETDVTRYTRRINKIVRYLHAEQTRTADEVVALIDLITEALPMLRNHQSPPTLPKIARSTAHLLVVVAGLRGNQPGDVERQVGGLAEIVFVDSTRKQPHQAGECDLFIATKWCGRSWIERARRIYNDKLTMAQGTTQVVSLIRQAVNKQTGIA